MTRISQFKMWGLSAGWGKRLNWPDDYFQLSAELSYQRYILKDWQYFPVTNGKCNDLSIGLTLARASYDNPIYPRSGSDFSLSVQVHTTLLFVRWSRLQQVQRVQPERYEQDA